MKPPFDSLAFIEAITSGQVSWRKHVLKRLLERGITQASVLECVCTGECIQAYPEDTLFPSALFFAFVENKPLHVVAAFDEIEKKAYIITTYEPSLDIFEPDFKSRKRP